MVPAAAVLMSAVMVPAAAVLMSAATVSAVMMSAAGEVRIRDESTVQVRLHCRTHPAAHSGYQPDSRLGQSHLRSTADSPADQYPDSPVRQKSGQRTVTGRSGRFNPFRRDTLFIDVKDGEFRCMSEMLEYLFMFAGDGYPHFFRSCNSFGC